MPKKLTLEMKKILNEEVTGETKRCLAILSRLAKDTVWVADAVDAPVISKRIKEAIKEMVEGSPYIEFHPELLKRIPK